MILQALCNYYQRKQQDVDTALPPYGFEEKGIPFVVLLSRTGKFIQLMDTRETDGKGKLVAKSYWVPQSVGRSGSNSYMTTNCLWDHYGYILGQPKLDKPDSKPSLKDIELADKQHETFKSFVKNIFDCLPDDIGVSAIYAFLDNSNEINKVISSPNWIECRKIKGCNLAFEIVGEGMLACQSETVKNYVVAHSFSNEAQYGRCLVTGDTAPISRLHSPISGVAAKPTPLCSINDQSLPSFASYGKSQGFNFPVGVASEFKYVTALNFLLASSNCFSIGQNGSFIKMVCWAEKRTILESIFPVLFGEQQKDNPDNGVRAVNQLFSSLHNGGYSEPDGQARFYLLGLSPNAARISVRFWQVGTVAEFAERLGGWFDDIDVIGREHYGYVPLKELLRATALLGKDENLSPNLVGETVRSILQGLPLPASLLSSVLNRIKAEKGYVSYKRAALIKACLNRKLRFISEFDKEVTVSLNPDDTRIGYRLGRLFAVLEKLQADANPGLNATIRDRYYSSASCTPKAVFGTLLRLHAHHLKKLENPAWKAGAEKKIADILGDIHEFPAHLNLDDQGLFAIGYYHQRQNLFTKKDSNQGEAQ